MQLTSRDELPNYFKYLGFKVGAEIGVYRGEYTEKFCQVGIHMYAVDPWAPFSGQGKSEQKQEEQDINYYEAKKRLTSFPNCTFIKKISMDALADFEPETLDFVYLDGDHKFRAVAEDLAEWTQKVRPGGVVAGHDYYTTAPTARNLICQVKPVVDAYIETFGITTFQTFGENDKYLSWMFFKP